MNGFTLIEGHSSFNIHYSKIQILYRPCSAAFVGAWEALENSVVLLRCQSSAAPPTMAIKITITKSRERQDFISR